MMKKIKMKQISYSQFFRSILLTGLAWGAGNFLFVKPAFSEEINSHLSPSRFEMAQTIFFGEDSIEQRQQEQKIEETPQNPQPTPEASTAASALENRPQASNFQQYFLIDALNGVADPLSGRGSSASRNQASDGQILTFIAENASRVGGLETTVGTLGLSINSNLQNAIDNGTISDFLGFGGSLTVTGGDGTVTTISVSRPTTNTATLTIGDAEVGITVNDFSGTGATISGDPLTGIAQLNAGTAGSITINGQPATIRVGLTGNDGVLQFVGDNGETIEIRVDNVVGVTQEQLDSLTLDSTVSGAVTFGTIPDQ
ncbi:MAG: hypothetical protein J7647_23990 [Cyanobacteria bacterium SBLK]|nr:hypothetical protein [Cyanobacteria bacterium SBLK]